MPSAPILFGQRTTRRAMDAFRLRIRCAGNCFEPSEPADTRTSESGGTLSDLVESVMLDSLDQCLLHALQIPARHVDPPSSWKPPPNVSISPGWNEITCTRRPIRGCPTTDSPRRRRKGPGGRARGTGAGAGAARRRRRIGWRGPPRGGFRRDRRGGGGPAAQHAVPLRPAAPAVGGHATGRRMPPHRPQVRVGGPH